MEILRTNNALEFEQFANNCLTGHEGLVIHECINPCVWTSSSIKSCNLIKAQELGLNVAYGIYYGGTIVCFEGDLSFCLTTWGRSNFGKQCLQALFDYCKKLQLSVKQSNNDILIDNKKVASWGSAKTNDGWVQTVVHFSVNVDQEIIDQICTKPQSHEAGALIDYGINISILNNILFDIINSL